MNRFFRICCLLLFFSFCIARSQSHWQVGIELNPVGYTPEVMWYSNGKEVEMGFNGAGFSYKGGITVYRELGLYFWLHSGLLYSRRTYDGSEVMPATGSREPDTVRVNTRTRDIQLPLSVQFRYGKHRWGVVLSSGILTGFRLRFAKFPEGGTYSAAIVTNRRPFLPAYISLDCTAGLYCQLNKGIILVLQAEVEHELESTVRRDPLLRTASTTSFYPKLTFVRTLD